MRKTIILLAVALGLAGYVYFFEIKGSEEKEKLKEAEEKICSFEKDSIRSILIQSFKGRYLLINSVDGWQLEQPVKTLADESTVNSLLNSLTSVRKSRTFFIKPGDKYGYGLGVSAVKLYLTLKNGVRDSLFLGDQTGIENNIYAARIDTIVYLVSSDLKNSADKSLFDWRDKKVIHFEKNEVREFTLANRFGQFSFAKLNDGWKILKPIETEADENTVDAVLNKLDYGRISDIIAEDDAQKSKFGLIRPQIRIDLFIGADKARKGISFSELKGNRAYGKDDSRNHIFETDSVFLQPFGKNLFDFRNKNVLDFKRDDIDRINLLYQGNLMTLEKDTSDNWTMLSGEKLKTWKVSSLISTLNNLKAERFVEENPRFFMNYGLINPEGKIELFSNELKADELNIGFQQGSEIFIYNPRLKPVMTIKESSIKELFPQKSEMIEETKQDTPAEGLED